MPKTCDRGEINFEFPTQEMLEEMLGSEQIRLKSLEIWWEDDGDDYMRAVRATLSNGKVSDHYVPEKYPNDHKLFKSEEC